MTIELTMTKDRTRANLVDSVFSWSVLMSCCIMLTLVAGFQASLGLLFVKWKYDFSVTATTTAWIGSSYMLVLHLTGTRLSNTRLENSVVSFLFIISTLILH